MTEKSTTNSHKTLVFLSILVWFWASLFEQFFILFWRAFQAPFWQVPPKEPREWTGPRAQKYFLKGTAFFVLRQRFFLRFLIYFWHFLFLFLSTCFGSRAIFLFIRQKNIKNKNHDKKQNKKTQYIFCLKSCVERGLLRPRRAGQSSAKNGQPQDPHIWTRIRPASVPLWGVDPATGPLPGPQNEVKKARKKRQK